MIIQISLILCILVYQKKLLDPFTITNRKVLYTFIYVMLCKFLKSKISYNLAYVLFLEDIFFRGILKFNRENTIKNNILSGIIFGLYEMIYIPKIIVFITSGFIGYILNTISEKADLYEMSIIRSILYLLIYESY